MCGRYNVIDSPEVKTLMEQLGLPGVAPRPQHNVPPGGIGEFVIEAADDRYLLPGIWSLLIEQNPNDYGFRPNPKFHTFNARSDRLTSSPLCRLARFMNGRASRSTTFTRNTRPRRSRDYGSPGILAMSR